jgi:hypothetical protein
MPAGGGGGEQELLMMLQGLSAGGEPNLQANVSKKIPV